MTRVRLFLALELPTGPRHALADWRDGWPGLADRLRPVAAQDLHVTVAFLGPTPEGARGEIWAGARRAVEGHRAPRLGPRGVVGVPRRRPRLLALELADQGGRARALHGALAQALAAGGHLTDPRPFWPHVTLARARRGARVPAGIEAPPICPFTASVLTLFRSELLPEGARYVALERLELDRTED